MKKGFTVVELVVTFSVTIVIATFLLQLILALNNIYLSSGIKTEIMNKQSLISNQINKTLTEKSISSLTSCGNYCLKFNYSDFTSDIFTIDYATNILSFGNYSTDLPEDTYFKNVSVDIVYAATIDEYDNNAILNIKIPIKNDDIKDDFYVNVAYQFNTNDTNIEYVNFEGNGSYIVLNGNTEQTFNTQTAFVEEGYTVYNANGAVITGNVEVDNPLTTLPYKAGNYKIKYSLKDNKGNIISQATRSVTVKPSTYDITNLVVNGSFEDDSLIFAENIDLRKDWAMFEMNSNYSKYGYRSIMLIPTDSTYHEAFVNAVNRYNFDSSHKYYYATWYLSDTSIDLYCLSAKYYNNSIVFSSTFSSSSTWTKASLYYYNYELISTDDLYFRLDINNNGEYKTGYFDGLLLIDLTEAFGAGNEPSKEWCDENIEWFEGTTKINY